MSIPSLQNLIPDWRPHKYGLSPLLDSHFPCLRICSDQINNHNMPSELNKLYPTSHIKMLSSGHLLLRFRLILHRCSFMIKPLTNTENGELYNNSPFTELPSFSFPSSALFFCCCLRNVSRLQSLKSLQILYFTSSVFRPCSWSIFQEGGLPVCTFCT